MNDNDRDDKRHDAAWVHDLLDKHDLHFRADTPEGCVVVLALDAACDLEIAGRCMHEERAVTAKSVTEVRRLIAMLEDALAFATLCDPT